MKQWKWLAGLLAGALLLSGLTAEAKEARAPAEPEAAAGEDAGWRLDESSVHVTDADGDDIMAEAIVMEADGKGRPSIRRAAYKLTGDQKDFVMDSQGEWRPVKKDSPDAACAARIRELLNDPARRAQFVAELQQVLMKQWTAREKAREQASVVVVTIEPAGQPAAENTRGEAEPDAKTDTVESRSGAGAPGSGAVTPPDRTKETAPSDGKKASPAGKPEDRNELAEKGRGDDRAPEQKKPAAPEEPAVVVEITSHEPQVTIEPMPSAEIRPEPGEAVRR